MRAKEDLKVVVTYKNERLQDVSTKEYSFQEYVDMMRLDLLRIITDVEDVLYDATDGADKENWSPTIMAAFKKIKHKLLDKAGEIGRLPENVMPAKPVDYLAKFLSDTFELDKKEE